MHERAHVVEVESCRVRQESRDLTLKTSPLAGRSVRPERSKGGLGRAGLSKNVFMQIPAKDLVELRKC